MSPRADDINGRAEFGLGNGVDGPLGGCGGFVHILQNGSVNHKLLFGLQKSSSDFTASYDNARWDTRR